MKRVVASIAATIASLVLLLGFKTHSPTATIAQSASTSTNDNNVTNNNTVDETTTTGAPTKSATVDGDEASTKWGPVKVEIVVSGGKITRVTALEYPNSNSRDISINNQAIPALISQTLQAQSANIDGVSGATYTTDGFITSLQSALSKAPTR